MLDWVKAQRTNRFSGRNEIVIVNINPVLHARLHQLLADYGTKVRILVEGHGLAKHGIDGADIEQEVRIRLWRALEREPDAMFNSSFIQHVVKSTVIDAIRAANCRPTEPLPDENVEGISLIDPAASPELTAVDCQQVELLAQHLKRLPARRRAAVQLHLEGFTAQEVGERTGTSQEAARKMAERGLATLQRRLSDAGILRVN